MMYICMNLYCMNNIFFFLYYLNVGDIELFFGGFLVNCWIFEFVLIKDLVLKK